MWQKEMGKVSGKHDGVEQWDDHTKRFEEWMKKDDYPKNVIQRIKLNKDWTVLDIGCGTGALTIPMAKDVKHVTALDISKKMLGFLRERALKEKMSNITYLNKSWEDVVITKEYEHDVVISSRSLGMFDLKEELTKIDRAAKWYAYVTWKTGKRKFEEGVYKMLGREYHDYPSYIYICNMLYQMGIYANVEFFECKRVCRLNLDDAIADWRCRIGDLCEEEEERLKEYLMENLTETEEGTLISGEKSKWALIWWKKGEVNE